MSFEGARVAGTLDLDGAQISCPGNLGLDLKYAAVEGTLSCRRMTVEGVTRANNCRVGVELVMGGALLENPGGDAFFAGGLNVAGGAFFNRGFTARGRSGSSARGWQRTSHLVKARSPTRAAWHSISSAH